MSAPAAVVTDVGIGFTGTREGMTARQARMLGTLLDSAPSRWRVFRHGDCIGSDQQAAALARRRRFKLIGHPPTNRTLRAWVENDHTLAPMAYLERNYVIVNSSAVLIATPRGPELLRSGTWATIRYARHRRVPCFVIMPDGSVVRT